MAKKGRKSRRAKLHRTCGAMAAHMMLLERFPSYRVNQMRLEAATSRRRDQRINLRQARIVTIKTVVNVVYKTTEQNVSTAQINSQIRALNKDFRATNPDKTQTPAAWTGLVTDSRIQFKVVKVTRTKTTKDDFTHDDGVKRTATGGVAPFNPTTHLNIWVCSLRDSLLGYAQFPGGPQSTDGRDRPLLQPAAHLGRHARLQRVRHGAGHAELRRPQHRHAGVSDDHLQQRTEWRHVRQLHGLHRRCRHVHVHDAAGSAHANDARYGAEWTEVMLMALGSSLWALVNLSS